MKKYIFALMILFIAPLPGFSEPPDKECLDWTQKAIEDPRIGCEESCGQAKNFDKYDYHSGLIEAHNTIKGFEKFIEYTARSTIMGAGADEQGCHLVSLLNKWGDDKFFKTASKVSEKAKYQIIGLIDYTGIQDFEKRFPKTYRLSSHEE